MRDKAHGSIRQHDVTLRWIETDPANPAKDVLIRLIALTDDARDEGGLAEYLMEPGPDGTWSRTLRLAADLRTAYQFCPVRDRSLRGEDPDEDRWMDLLAAGVPDPTASDALPSGTVWGNPGPASILELPDALPQPWVALRPGVEPGAVPGAVARVELGRSVVHIWTPPDSGRPLEDLPVVISFDGASLLRIGIATTFANLVADRAVPPFVAVLIESIHGSADRGPTRVRSLTDPGEFADFVLGELLPYLRDSYPVTDDPRRTVIAGQSLGGLAAAHLATVAPDQVGWVIGQSTALWWPGDEDGGLSGASVIAGYDEAPEATESSVRFFLEAGSQERDLLAANHRFREVLEKRGYAVSFREYRGGHDYACWRGGLADGLIAALGSAVLSGAQEGDSVDQ
jgi:enterochelin esterase-like enzyme